MPRGRLYRELFLSVFRLSACTFGGGYVIVPLMKKRFVDQLHWIVEREMLDMISISQSAPGPIAVNASLMIGYRMGGVRGALICALGTVLPPLIIITLISFIYRLFRDNAYIGAVMRGMRAGAAAVICNAVMDMGSAALLDGRWYSGAVMAGAFVAVYFLHISIVWVILFCGALGFLHGRLAAKHVQERERMESK